MLRTTAKGMVIHGPLPCGISIASAPLLASGRVVFNSTRGKLVTLSDRALRRG